MKCIINYTVKRNLRKRRKGKKVKKAKVIARYLKMYHKINISVLAISKRMNLY
jgi:hypothetical protein